MRINVKINMNEIGKTYSIGKMRKPYKVGNLCLDGKKILKWI
jgi:hypothetical protein